MIGTSGISATPRPSRSPTGRPGRRPVAPVADRPTGPTTPPTGRPAARPVGSPRRPTTPDRSVHLDPTGPPPATDREPPSAPTDPHPVGRARHRPGRRSARAGSPVGSRPAGGRRRARPVAPGQRGRPAAPIEARPDAATAPGRRPSPRPGARVTAHGTPCRNSAPTRARRRPRVTRADLSMTAGCDVPVARPGSCSSSPDAGGRAGPRLGVRGGRPGGAWWWGTPGRSRSVSSNRGLRTDGAPPFRGPTRGHATRTHARGFRRYRR